MEESDLKPRNYQIALMEIALCKNSVIFLPTGSGKTFIALMVLNKMSGDLLIPYSDGGKISVILVNTVPLVEQHGKYIRNHTILRVGCYSGEMNVDFWNQNKWSAEFDKNQVLVMTCAIFQTLVEKTFIDLNKVNLLILDECHHAVNDHSMRQTMRNFSDLTQQPRVLGLTATILNGNCKPNQVIQEVKNLEVTLHGQVATVDGLENVVGYSTNPQEDVILYSTHKSSPLELECNEMLTEVVNILSLIRLESDQIYRTIDLPPLEPKSSLKDLANMITDLIITIDTFGVFGGSKACTMALIRVERLRIKCNEIKLLDILNYVTTVISHVKSVFDKVIDRQDTEHYYKSTSSNKLLILLEILKSYKTKSKEELCAIIFTKRRSTAQVLYHILMDICENNSELNYIKPNFIVGYNNNPNINTAENLFLSKKNKQVLEDFTNKECNIICASSVLEEGIDVPTCSLVIRFDEPEEYRAYIQSKGRARHKNSLYYIMIDETNQSKYMSKYHLFKTNENILNEYLIGKNTLRTEPDVIDIEKMYNEDEIPPYYTNGANSAKITMLSAIALLCHYCNCIPCDVYTSYQPEWYVEQSENTKDQRVVIVLPIKCPIKEYIYGPYMKTKNLAKRAAALQACILLHKMGELTDNLMPTINSVEKINTQFLFEHYPDVKEERAGTGKNRRLHKKHIAKCLQQCLTSEQLCYLHIIYLEPSFKRSENVHESVLYDIYTSQLCYGILTAQPLLNICDFPIYVTQGRINVRIKINQSTFKLSIDQINNIKSFHYCVFNDVLNIFQNFFLFDQNGESEMLYVVPVDLETITIDFKTIFEHQQIKSVTKPTIDERKQLVVTRESYFKKIVTPWYREPMDYIVTEVSLNKSPQYEFPNDEYSSFADYFANKYQINVLNKHQPLVLVKGISKRLNFIKPYSLQHKKRKRERCYEETEEYLVPEMLIKQDFPSSLWLQAKYLPTILMRCCSLLKAEEFRMKVALEADLGVITLTNYTPLILDDYLIDYNMDEEDKVKENDKIDEIDNISAASYFPASKLHFYNRGFAAKVLENEYPWKNIDEPKDIHRTLNVTSTDIYYYEKFISVSVNSADRELKNNSPTKLNLPAITYQKDFVHKPIKLLNNKMCIEGPQLCEIYRALTTAKVDDIMNLERLETLGDSFLKMIVSVYLFLRFPTFSEGELTTLKGRIVSNKNLYYLAVKKNLNGLLRFQDLSPKEEWLPPCYTIPQFIKNDILNRQTSINSLFNLYIPHEEQITGDLNTNTINDLQNNKLKIEDLEENSYNNMSCFLNYNYVGDKFISDVVESLLGAYFEACGFDGVCKLIEWFGIIPKTENLLHLLNKSSPNPILNNRSTIDNINYYIPQWMEFEKRLGYHFNNRGYLLEALTHASYTPNRITLSYEKLEFIGDAVLDFLITCHIYESCGKLSPGELTDLRSALVNNNTFASLLVRNGFHKFLLSLNEPLQRQIDKFANFLEDRNYVIDDEVLILLDEGDIKMAEYIDVPKALGDVFEAIAGAVYLDSNKNLKTVWQVFYKIMWNEIELFSQNVPKNVIRRIYESNTYPLFSEPRQVKPNVTMVDLEFLLDGRRTRVHGFGSNKQMAKKAAAKIALRSLEK